MMLTSMIATYENDAIVQSSPELRRMDMYNRARREELNTMLLSMDPRHNVNRAHGKVNRRPVSPLVAMFNGVRNAIGNVLISAGSRIQSAA